MFWDKRHKADYCRFLLTSSSVFFNDKKYQESKFEILTVLIQVRNRGHTELDGESIDEMVNSVDEWNRF